MTDTDLPTPRLWATIRSPEDLGEFIARLRFARGYTQKELVEQLGISRRYLYALESGATNLFARRLFEVLNLLGARVTVEELLESDSRSLGREPKGRRPTGPRRPR